MPTTNSDGSYLIKLNKGADTYNSITPYQFANDNPIAFNDPTGLKTADEWNAEISDLWNNSPYGGYATANGSG